MRYLSIWMLVSECRGKEEGWSWLLNFTYLACVSDFTYCKPGNVRVKIFVVFNFHGFI